MEQQKERWQIARQSLWLAVSQSCTSVDFDRRIDGWFANNRFTIHRCHSMTIELQLARLHLRSSLAASRRRHHSAASKWVSPSERLINKAATSYKSIEA